MNTGTIVAIALSSTIIPIISSAKAKNDFKTISEQSHFSVFLALLTGLPMSLGLSSIALPLNGLLFTDLDGSFIISALCFVSLFQIMMMVTTSIIQGMGNSRTPMYYFIVAIITKIVFNFLSISFIGIYGVIFSTGLSLLVITVLNLMYLKREIKFNFFTPSIWKVLFSALCMTIFVNFSVWCMLHFVPVNGKLTYGSTVLVSVIVGGLIYTILLIKLKTLTAQHLDQLPTFAKKTYTKLHLKLNKKESKKDRDHNL